MKEKANYNQLYGLRALAIALVVASHCEFLDQGGLSVAMMFCLSGFLAVRPFGQTDMQFHSVKDVLKYYLKKIQNVYPSYFLIIVVLKLLSEDFFFTWDQVLRMLVFAEAPGHLWFLQQTMVFYLVTPLIMIILWLFTGKITGHKRYLFLAVLAAVLAVLAFLFRSSMIMDIDILSRPWYLYQYLTGMTFGYLFHYLKNADWSREYLFEGRAGKWIIQMITLILFALIFLSSDQILKYVNPGLEGYYVGWSGQVPCVILAGVFITLLCIRGDCLVSKLFRIPPFVSLGKVSYEIYILHWYLLGYLNFSSHHSKNFLILYICTAGAAYLVSKVSKWPWKRK